ncbi:phosphate/phosphite/phosphonate ABC transporter substrate-binding protein [Enhygromyxa salina]|uniref:ABC transporter, phosphonate, periplasmic substrate-binding protein n=1 Tax=Enhygromyxa salina TaxID=215803 RepID=A0A2S9XL42_9BACT|nr:PhnD/SsuA/transferrin family substrate-binding protein [Enhygromyxa salina]PRP93557.1 ABC transporter, phosphonate, periplasmic substrate-binding protein [Enhygromyxa salina]
MTTQIVLGAVAYDPKVVTIWEGFKAWFADQGLDFDYVLFSNYERQVQAHFDGVCNVAWNSPLAWLEAERLGARLGRRARAVVMRDSDCDLTSVVVARAGAGIAKLEDLRGKTIAVGASDSPQATLIPLGWLASHGLEPGRDFEVVKHEIAVGMHGDHVGGERHAARDLIEARVDAAAMIDANHLAFSADGTLPAGSTVIVGQTPTYDHCNFTVLDGIDAALLERFVSLLLGQSFEDPRVRPLLELEGLKRWLPGRTSGYALLDDAITRFGTIDSWLDTVSRRP